MKYAFISAIVASVVLVGCATSRTLADPRIFIDDSASNLIRVLTLDYGETKGANQVVSLSVQSTSGSTRKLQYRAVWIGPDGSAVDSVLSIWNLVTLDPGEVADLKAVAPRSDTKGFRFEVRKAP